MTGLRSALKWPVLLLVAVAMLAAFRLWQGARGELRVDNAFVTGRVITIAAPVDGTVDMIGMRRFARHPGGGLAFAIDRARLHDRTESAQLALRSALLDVGRECLKLPILHQRTGLSEEARQLAARKVAESRELHAKGYISTRQYEQLLFEANQAKGQQRIDALELRRAAMPANRGVNANKTLTDAVIQLRAALIAQRQAEVRLAGDVFVYDLGVIPGQWVEAGTPLATVIPSDEYRVQANLLEAMIGRVSIGQQARIRLDGSKGARELRGVVEAIVPTTAATLSRVQRNTADSTWVKVSQRIPVIVRITDDVRDGGIFVGESAEVVLLEAVDGQQPVSRATASVNRRETTPVDQDVERRILEEQARVKRELGLSGQCLFTRPEQG